MNAARSSDFLHDPSTGPALWKAALAAAVPLALFLLFSFIRWSKLLGFPPLVMPNRLNQFLWMDVLRVSVEPPLIFYLLVLAGFLVAWVKGFPRWSDTTLGWLVTILLIGLGAVRPSDPYFWVSWAPFFLTLIVALLLSRSIEPIKNLWRGWRQDWTRASLALLPLLQFLVWAGFDEMPGPVGARVFWQGAAMGVLVAGVVWVMQARSKPARILAILASAALSVSVMLGANAYYWQTYPKARGPVMDGTETLSSGLLFLGVVIILLLAPALLSVKRIRRPS